MSRTYKDTKQYWMSLQRQFPNCARFWFGHWAIPRCFKQVEERKRRAHVRAALARNQDPPRFVRTNSNWY